MIAKIKRSDWGFLQAVSFNSIAIAIGRIVGFAFSFIVARKFSTDEFGYITYVITLGTIVAIVSQPFGQHVMAYFIGKYREDKTEYEAIMSNLLLIFMVILSITLFISSPILKGMGYLSIELIIVFLGISAFYTYYGIASGFLASKNLSYVYIGSNIVQAILVVFVVYVLNIRNTSLVIAIYGFSYFPPILFLSIYYPLPIKFRSNFDLKRMIQIAKTSAPILFSHALFVGYTKASIILVSFFMNETAIGIFGFTITLVSIFEFIPNAFTWLLMPKIAGMVSGRKAVVLMTITALTIVNIVGVTIFLAVYEWGVVTFFDETYFLNMEFVIVLVMTSVLGGYHSILTATFVGIGKPGYQTLSQMIMLFVVLFSGITLIPVYGLMGAAAMQLSGYAVGLGIYVIFLLSNLKKEKTVGMIATAKT